MRHVHFDGCRQRLGRIWRARQVAVASAPPAADGRPLPDEIATLAIHALENQGPGAGALEVADDWLAQLRCHWHEYGVALENLRLGIGPPTSGAFNNDAYGECTGGVLRADVWGFIYPGDPAEAARRAAEDATLDHFGDAADVARFLAGLVAEAFMTEDLRPCVRAGFNQLSTSSRAALCVQTVLNLASREKDARRAWAVVAADWGHPEPTNVIANLAGLLLALAAGDLDWPRTFEIARATGGDVTAKVVACATVLGALGVEVPAASGSRRTKTLPAGRAPRLRGPAPAGDALADVDPFKSEEDFTERICRLAVACARPDEVEITGAPYFPAAGPPVARPLRLAARYEGGPVIAPGESRAVFLEKPHGTDDIPGAIEVDAPEGLAAAPMGGVTVPGKIAARVVNVSLVEPEGGDPGKEREAKVPAAVRARIVRGGRTVAEAKFGFHLARVYVAMGPFDNSEGKGFEQQYLPEAKLSEKLAEKPSGWRQPFHTNRLVTSGDLVDVDGAFGSVGPRVVYLVRVVMSPVARRVALRVGSSDSVKLWLNGRRLVAENRQGFAMSNDYVIPASLRKGANRIVVKHARSGLTSTFRLRITERDSEEAVTDLWDAL